MKVLFLDIDGVLNTTEMLNKDGPLIDQKAVRRLNAVVAATQCSLVLSSSWRYQIVRGQMTLNGFDFLLFSHGIIADLIGYTCSDEILPGRENQIRKYVTEHGLTCWAVIDNLPLDIENFVHISDGGLNDTHVTALINLLQRKPL